MLAFRQPPDGTCEKLENVTNNGRIRLGTPNQRLESRKIGEQKLSGNVIIAELLRNMELGKFEMTYSVLLPCIFTIYLNPDDHAALSGVSTFISEDARKALQARVVELNAKPSGGFSLGRRGKPIKEHKIACTDWELEFLPDAEVPRGDVEIHSELSASAEPGFRGTKTTLIEREPTATAARVAEPVVRTDATVLKKTVDMVHAEIRYRDESGSQVFLISQNKIRVGRGGDDAPMDLALYTADEVSREHLTIRRDPASGLFFITDLSTNGTSVNTKRLRKGIEEPLPDQADLNLGDALTLHFEVRK
jgi:hypothetical protein